MSPHSAFETRLSVLCQCGCVYYLKRLRWCPKCQCGGGQGNLSWRNSNSKQFTFTRGFLKTLRNPLNVYGWTLLNFRSPSLSRWLTLTSQLSNAWAPACQNWSAKHHGSFHVHLAFYTHGPLQLDLDEFSVQNAYFRPFNIIVRRQLNVVWHNVGPKTKQLVNDLAMLRRLL